MPSPIGCSCLPCRCLCGSSPTAAAYAIAALRLPVPQRQFQKVASTQHLAAVHRLVVLTIHGIILLLLLLALLLLLLPLLPLPSTAVARASLLRLLRLLLLPLPPLPPSQHLFQRQLPPLPPLLQEIADPQPHQAQLHRQLGLQQAQASSVQLVCAADVVVQGGGTRAQLQAGAAHSMQDKGRPAKG